MRRVVVFAAICLLAVTAEAQKVVDTEYHFTDKKTHCDGAPCILSPVMDDSIRFAVCEAPGGLLTVTVTAPELPEFRLTAAQMKQLGLTPGQAGGGTSDDVVGAIVPDDVVAGYVRLREAIDAIASWVRSPTDANDFAGRSSEANVAYQTLVQLTKSPSSVPSELAKALRRALRILDGNGNETNDLFPPLIQSDAERDPAEWLKNVADVIGKSRLGTGCYAPDTFNVEVPFDIKIVWASTNPLIQAPVSDSIPIRFPTWKIVGATGFAFSGLSDDQYTFRTEVVTPASGTTPAVTKRIAVREERDAYLPEVTGFLHFTKVGPLFNVAKSLQFLVPRQLSVGGGLSAGPSGRVYLGLSWPLGRVGSLTAGLAGGPVKRLSKNVDTNNLGDSDPQASRRDILRTAVFFGVSFRVTD